MTSQIFGSCRHLSPDECLNSFHLSAAVSNTQGYFGCFFDEHSRFLGTDASENWTSVEFFEYSQKAFATPSAWEYTYIIGSRKLLPVLDNQIACFDELLQSKSFHCTTRGSGTVIKRKGYWFIVQYHLSFPTPNDLAHIICKQIELYESNQHKKAIDNNNTSDNKSIINNTKDTSNNDQLNFIEATNAAALAAEALLKEVDQERTQHQSSNNNNKTKGKSKK